MIYIWLIRVESFAIIYSVGTTNLLKWVKVEQHHKNEIEDIFLIT